MNHENWREELRQEITKFHKIHSTIIKHNNSTFIEDKPNNTMSAYYKKRIERARITLNELKAHNYKKENSLQSDISSIDKVCCNEIVDDKQDMEIDFSRELVNQEVFSSGFKKEVHIIINYRFKT